MPPPANSFTPLPFGLRDLKVYPLAGEVYTAGAGIDLPNNQKLTFAEAEVFVELRGDDALVAVHGKGPQVDWDITAGGVSLDAIKVMFGGTIVETGVWANGTGTGKRVYTKLGNQQRPYFRIEGQAYSDSGGDFHVNLYRCKANGNLTGMLDENAFWLTGAKGIALPRASDSSLYDLVQNEQVLAIPGPPVVVSIAPAAGGVAGGTVVTVQGAGFTGATAVNFGVTPGTGLSVVTDSTLNITSPAKTAGPYDITVVTPAGTSPTGTQDRFTYS